MLFLLTHPENEQQALVGAATENGAKRLITQKMKDAAWQQSTVQVPSEGAQDTIFWVVQSSSPPRKVTKPSKSSKKEKGLDEKELDDGANRDDRS